MNEPREELETTDVCVIGAGWSGLLAAHHMQDAGFDVLLLERREGLGGVWRYSADPDVVTVMESTITSSSAAVTEASDFPMELDWGNFVHHRDILGYLEKYAAHWGLTDRIRFGRSVDAATQDGDGWVITGAGFTVRSRFLVVSAGLHQRRRDPSGWFEDYTGTTLHVGSIKGIAPDAFGPDDDVLVYGGGESASDVVEQLAATKAGVTWAIPNGQHFFRKAAYGDRPAVGKYRQTDSPLDEACSRAIQIVSPFHHSKPGMKWLCMIGSTGSVLDYEGHGIPEWRKGVPFMHAFINKNGHVIEHVREGRVRAEGKVESVDGRTVRFASGRTGTYTHVIACTGYHAAFPFLDPALGEKCVEERYKMIFDPDVPNAAFIGYARPTVGSIPLVAEIQCFYASRVFAGTVQLPTPDAMREEITADRAARDAYFCGRRRPPGLVHIIDYGHEVAELAGVRPHYGRMFLRDPIGWFKTFFAPAQAAQFRIVDPARRAAAVAQIWRRQRKRYYVYPWIYLLARLLWIDPIVERAHAWHLRRQEQSRDEEPRGIPSPARS